VERISKHRLSNYHHKHDNYVNNTNNHINNKNNHTINFDHSYVKSYFDSLYKLDSHFEPHFEHNAHFEHHSGGGRTTKASCPRRHDHHCGAG
jgi:hypothetical protein